MSIDQEVKCLGNFGGEMHLEGIMDGIEDIRERLTGIEEKVQRLCPFHSNGSMSTSNCILDAPQYFKANTNLN